MKSTVETLSPTRVRLAIEVPFVELEPSLRKAYREIGSQVTVPGFRAGKVPAKVIDQRVGRNVVLNEAVQDALLPNILAALREHDVKSLGSPEVDVVPIVDGEPLKFTAELDVRPELTLPDLNRIHVTIDELQVADSDVEEQLEGVRQRFATLKTVDRPAAKGDYVQIDLAATIDGVDVPGGSATNISHEIGSNQSLPGLDDTLVGLAADAATTFTTQLVGSEFAGKDASVAVTVRTVKEKQLPPLDDDFAQIASEFDTLDELRSDLKERITRIKRVEQLYSARDKALAELVAQADVPAPEGVVRQDVESRKQSLMDELERIGMTFEQYLAEEEKTEEQVDADLTENAIEGIKIQLALDTLADNESIEVTDDEFGHEIMHRAQRVGMPPQAYYDQLVRAGAAGSVQHEIRRGKAITIVMERAKITDTNGAVLTMDELRSAATAGEDHTGHDHD